MRHRPTQRLRQVIRGTLALLLHRLSSRIDQQRVLVPHLQRNLPRLPLSSKLLRLRVVLVAHSIRQRARRRRAASGNAIFPRRRRRPRAAARTAVVTVARAVVFARFLCRRRHGLLVKVQQNCHLFDSMIR